MNRLAQGDFDPDTPPAAAYDSDADSERADQLANLFKWRADLGPLLATDPPGRDWLFDERIEAGRGVLLTGLGGSSKTRLLYYLALGAVLGRLPWAWTVNRTGAAVLVLTEDTERDLHETLHAICRDLNVTADERARIEAGLHIFPLAGHQFRLLDTVDGRTLMRTGWYRALQALIGGLGDVAFVGLDPALALTAGDELDQGHQRLLGKAVDDLAVNTGASVVLTSHATKASLGQDELTSHSSRGGGAITDAVRGEFSMRTMTPTEAVRAGIANIEERKRHVQLVGTKGNHLPPAAYVPIWLRRGSNGTLAAADITLDSATAAVRGQREQQALEVLVAMRETTTPRLSEWRDECVRRAIVTARTDDAASKAMRRIVNNLRDAGLIERGMGSGIWIPTESVLTDE